VNAQWAKYKIGHFESICFHSLVLFNLCGDYLAPKLRPSKVHSGDG
jgi:hypothetical protein